MPPRATPPHHFLSGAGFYTGESGDTGAAGPSEAGGCARRAEGSAGDRPEGTPRVTSPPPSCSPSLRGHQGTPRLLPAPSLPPLPASPRSLLSTSSRLGFAGMLLLPMVWDASGSSPPLAVLPFGLGFGAWQSLGPGRRGLVAVGGVLAVTCVTLCRVVGGGGRLQPPGSGRRSNHAARLVPERGPRAAAVRDTGAVLAPAGIPGFFSQPLSPLSAAPAARGALFHLPHANAPFWVEGLASSWRRGGYRSLGFPSCSLFPAALLIQRG